MGAELKNKAHPRPVNFAAFLIIHQTIHSKNCDNSIMLLDTWPTNAKFDAC
jgi:hypothetical protein